jgi:hypothetical protein
VRERYPSTSKFGRRGVRNFNGPAPPPAFATDALPGTAAKVATLEYRAARGLDLWHPDDATWANLFDGDTAHDGAA